MSEITLSRLSEDTGLTIHHLSMLVKRGILPEGRREGRNRLLPEETCKAILLNHDTHRRWKSQPSSPDWSKLI